MAESLSPVSAAAPDRRAGRRRTDPALAHEAKDASPPPEENLPIPAPSLRGEEGSAAAFEAQLLGQDGQKRGLRGGPPVLNQARSAYLGAEWSGEADRRPTKGVITKTEI